MVKRVTVIEMNVCLSCNGTGSAENGENCGSCNGTGSIGVQTIR